MLTRLHVLFADNAEKERAPYHRPKPRRIAVLIVQAVVAAVAFVIVDYAWLKGWLQ